MNPTAEQEAALAAFKAGKSLVLEAGAGTGKTSTLRLLAQSTTKRGLYIAYNKSIADEAASKFPANVTCKTAHSLAYAAIGKQYRARLNGSRVPAWKAAKSLGITSPLQVGERYLAPDRLANIALGMVAQFCKSADSEISVRHLPYVEGLEETPGRGEGHKFLARELLSHARAAWADLQKLSGNLSFSHDHYLKLWQLSEPVLRYDFLFLDEAQDANPVIDAVVSRQTHIQRVIVGDRAQAIYGWNGAIDAMAKFPCDERLYLSESFRFGVAVAEEANRWLERLSTPLRIVGQDSIPSEVLPSPEAQAVLCRTNAGAVQTALTAQANGKSVAIVGDQRAVVAFARGAQDLMHGVRTKHNDLSVFRTWTEVQRYVRDDASGADLAVLVNLVDKYGPEVIISALSATVSEDKADIIVSTAHKAKGREWDSVRIADDFKQREDKDGNLIPFSQEDIMLRYVAVTRAKLTLDLGPLPVSA